MIRRTIAAAAVLAALSATGPALAKLPPLDDAAKAKAAEAAAKAAWQGKVDAWQMCKVQDKIAASYRKTAAPAAAKAASMPSSASAATKPTSATASEGGSTPVAGVAAPAPAWPGCADPGPYAAAPAEQKPLETSGAHSPATNATSPPSNRATSAEMAPSKPGAAAKP